MSAVTYTWGISGPDFLWFYAGLCAAVAAGIACAWWLACGAAGDGTATTRELDMFELALLNGGPELAVTTAVTKMLHDGVLRQGADGSLVTVLQPGIGACRIEREIFDAVSRSQAIDIVALQHAMAANDGCWAPDSQRSESPASSSG
ncbi:MAG TPA: TIGR04222 domain-containing membrane protein [Solirubrobacteraceae bacterium]